MNYRQANVCTIRVVLTDANLIKIHAELSELLGKQVQVCKCIVGSRKVKASEMEKKKMTSARRMTLLKKGLYKTLAEKQLDGYQ